MPSLLILLLAVAVVLAAILLWRPYLLGRWLLVIFVRLFYRMRVFGAENVPERGGALLVCNHVSYIDWVLLLVAQRRFIRFVLFAGWTRILFIRHILRWGRAIPIDAASGPKAILKSLRTAGGALAEGDLVCIFAEGRFTRTGFLLPFHRGFEQIVKNSDAPIIPVCLDELWGSVFSFYGDRTLWKWPRMVPYPVSVAFGKPMPATSSAAEVRLAVQKLSADCAIARTEGCRTLPREFVRTAARRPWAKCVTETGDGSPKAFSYSTVLAQAMCLARELRNKLHDQPLVGIRLPQGLQATIAHLALAFCGKAVVHLNEASSPDRLHTIIAQAKLTQVLSSSAFLGRYPIPAAQATDQAMPEVIDVGEFLNRTSSGRRILAKTCAMLLPGAVMERWVLKLGTQKLDDLAAVVFTGDGDRLRGVRVSHRNLVASVSAISKTFDLVPSDRLLATWPLSDCVGYTCGLWAPLSVGMSVVPCGDANIGEPCRTHRCTVWPTTPGQLATVTGESSVEDFKSLKTLIVVGDTLSEETSKDIRERLGILPLLAYARTELTSIAATNVPDKTLENFTQVGHKPGSVGQPLPGMAARIVDANTLAPLPPQQEGTLAVCGPNVMQGYLNDTRQATGDGWFVTGDRAVMDEEGFITLK